MKVTHRSYPMVSKVVLADNLFVDMAGVFEYDFELKEKGEHRKFLRETASFKQVSGKTSAPSHHTRDGRFRLLHFGLVRFGRCSGPLWEVGRVFVLQSWLMARRGASSLADRGAPSA